MQIKVIELFGSYLSWRLVLVMFNCLALFSGGSSYILQFEDIERFKTSTGCSSIMLARAAQWNPSIFSADGMRPLDEVIKNYIRYVCSRDFSFLISSLSSKMCLIYELILDGPLFMSLPGLYN